MKKGISMLMLVVTILMMIIIMSTITVSINITTGRENISTLENNLSTIEEYVDSCRILNEELPFSSSMSYEDVKKLVDSNNFTEFNNELMSNGDSVSSTFRKVEISEIGIKKEFYGYGKNGKDDIFVYSEDTGIAYYLKGVLYKGERYFSISSRLTNFVK